MKKATTTPHEWSEDKLQAELFRWFVNEFPALRGSLFSVPNGSNKSGFNAKIFKATGLWSGVADLLFMINGNTYCIEMKRPDGKGSQSDSQKEWQLHIQRQGFKYVLFNDLLDAQDFILDKILENTETNEIDILNKPNKQLKMF